MDTLLDKVLTTGGPLGVLVVVVFLFLRHLATMREDDRKLQQSMHEQHLQSREETRSALHENATNTRENTRALQSLELAVNRLTNGK